MFDLTSTAINPHYRPGDEQEFYSRQTILPEIGTTGQLAFKKSRVLTVGAGGLGCSALAYLASAGLGTVGICESDLLEASNLHRQILYSYSDIGKPKVELAARRLQELNPFIEVVLHAERLTHDNVERIIAAYDLVVDCSDTFATKFLINDACVRLRTPFVQAGIYQYEGQIQVYKPDSDSACLRCLWPEIPAENCVGSCTEAGVIGAVAGLFGTLQAMEVLKLIVDLPTTLSENLLLIDLLTCDTRRIKRKRSSSCPVCNAASRSADSVSKGKSYFARADKLPVAVTRAVHELELDLERLTADDLASYQLIDIRETMERTADTETFAISMPLSSFNHKLLDKHQRYLVFCQRGIRSHKLVETLREHGLMNVYSVKGGVWSVKDRISNARE